jgi:hypothetical protein
LIEPPKTSVYRNYETVLKGMGASVAFGNNQNDLFMTLKKDGRETWFHLSGNELDYVVAIAEKGGMLQINFDTGKAIPAAGCQTDPRSDCRASEEESHTARPR